MPHRNLKEANLRIKQLERKVKELTRLITRDHLTGLLNRRGMEEALMHHFSLVSRNACEKNNFTVLYLDLDRFKGINDVYGHHTGDEVIKFFAKILSDTLRADYDLVVRLGGDEFIVILPGCGADQAEQVIKKIKGALVENSFVANGVMLSLRTSIGAAAALDPESKKVRSLDTILSIADESMYADKKRGRALRKKPPIED